MEELVKDSNATERSWLDAWHVHPSVNPEYALVDGLRGIAILTVLIGHQLYVNAKFCTSAWGRFLYYFINPGFGVTIFFALSGFLISLPFWKLKIQGGGDVVPRGYGWRRFWKIYPPLALSIVFFAAVGFWRSGDSVYGAAAFKWLAGWPLLFEVPGKLNSVMWSLAVEVQFYLVLPLLFLGLRRTTAGQCRWLLLLSFTLVPNLIHWMCYGGERVLLSPNVVTHFPANLDSFAFGILIAGLECQRLLRPSHARLGDLGFVLLVLAFAVSAWGELQSSSVVLFREVARWGAMAASGLMILYVADSRHPRSRLLCAPWLRWCGLVSYELYLFHQPQLLWARELFGRPQEDPAKLLILLVGNTIAALMVAAVIYHFFSLPILRFGRNRRSALVSELSLKGSRRE